METAKSPVIKSRDGKGESKYLDFNQAIKEVMNGKKVTKMEWADKKYYTYLQNDVLLLHKPDGKDYHWILSLGDLEGIDYIVL